MANPIQGAGALIVNDILTDCAFALLQPSVNTKIPVGGTAAGQQTVDVYDASMWVGAQIIVGAVGSSDIEVVTITALDVGVSFTATFKNTHGAGEPITGATFPVRQPTDALFQQAEMIAYLFTATNDFLTDCPLVYEIDDSLTLGPTVPSGPLPYDCMMPVRLAIDWSSFIGYGQGGYGQNGYGGGGTPQLYALRETSQTSLDTYDYRWNRDTDNFPTAYYRDKLATQNFGVWPVPVNTTNYELVYQRRQSETMGLADGFLFPDPFTVFVKYRVLSFAYSKDGEMRSPALAKMYAQKYDLGVKVSRMLLEVINDPNLQMAQ